MSLVFLGSACSSGLSIYCVIKTQVTAHLHRVPESRVVYRAETHIKEALACWTCSLKGQLSELTGLSTLQSQWQQPGAHRPPIWQAVSVAKLKSHCVIKGQYPLRRKASQTMELPCLRASRIFCHVSASSGSQVLSAPTSGGRMHLQHVQYTSGVYRLCEGKAGWCKADEDGLEPRAMCAGSVQRCVSKQQFHFSVIFSHRAHCW